MPPTITIRNAATGREFEFTPSEDLWLDMQAACQVFGWTTEQLIQRSLAAFFKSRDAIDVLDAANGPRRI